MVRVHCVRVRTGSADGLCQRLTAACARMKPVVYDMSHSTRDCWEIDRRSVIMQQLLGQGMYGQVWQGLVATTRILSHLKLYRCKDVMCSPIFH